MANTIVTTEIVDHQPEHRVERKGNNHPSHSIHRASPQPKPTSSHRRSGFDVRVFAWNCVSLPCIAIIYWVINAQGLRMAMPIFATRLWKLPIPGVSYLANYEGLYRLDLAHVFALILLFSVWYLWIVLVKTLLYGNYLAPDPKMNQKTYFCFLFTLAGILTLGDALLFYSGLSERVDTLWGTANPIVPILATIVYMAILAFVALVHVHLQADRTQN